MIRSFTVLLCLLCTLSCKERAGSADWFPESPIYPGVTWRLIGPGDADQVSAISVSRSGIVYVSTDIGGVYKSIDSGELWTPINQGIKSYDVVTPVIISPDNENILYIGTRGGIYKSLNGGEKWEGKWEGIGSGKPSHSTLSACIGAIAIDPVKYGTIYAGVGYRPSSEGSTVVKRIKWKGNIYRSDDRGESWKTIALLGENVIIRHILLMTSEKIYVATNLGLFKSVDAGTTWNNIFKIPLKYVTALPDKPDILYVSAGEKGIYKSVDGGSTWTEINNGLSKRSGGPLQTDDYTQLLIDRKNPAIVYAMNTTWGTGGGVYKSLDSGNMWQRITRWKEMIMMPWEKDANMETAWLKHSRRVNAAALDPGNNERLFIGTSRYIYKTDDGGSSWYQLISRKVSNDTWTHRGMNIFGHTRVVGIDPIDANRLYIGTVDHGLVKSEDGGKSWKESMQGMRYKDNIYDIAVNGRINSIVYVINGKGGFQESGIAKSNDYGDTWEQIDSGLHKTMYNTIIINPDNPDVLYIGGEGSVYMTRDGGSNWTMKNKGIEEVTVRKLLLDPVDKKTIFAATERGLYKTVDGGESWHRTHLLEMNLYSIVIDSGRNALYAAAVQDVSRRIEGGVLKSIDKGKNWERVLNINKIESIALMPMKPSIIYALSNDFQYHDESSGEGVFRSVDGGITWKSVNTGLSVLKGFNINIANYAPYNIYLSSNGSGVYVATEPAMAVNVP